MSREEIIPKKNPKHQTKTTSIRLTLELEERIDKIVKVEREYSRNEVLVYLLEWATSQYEKGASAPKK